MDTSTQGRRMVSTREAARSFHISHDYIGRLCRAGKVTGEIRDGNWYVDPDSLAVFLQKMAHQKVERKEELRRTLAEEYKKNVPVVHSMPADTRRHVTQSSSRSIPAPRFATAAVVFAALLFSIVRFGYADFARFANDGLVASVASPFSQFAAGGKIAEAFGIDTGDDSYWVWYDVDPEEEKGSSFSADVRIPGTDASETASAAAAAPTIVERVVERVTSAAGGITESFLNLRLADLEQRMVAQIAAVPKGETIVQTINNPIPISVTPSDFNGVTISGATISGSSFSASDLNGIVAISTGGTGTSSAPSYGNVLLGNAAGGYDLVATSTLGISGVSTFLALSDTPSSLTTGDLLYADSANNLAALSVGASANGSVLKLVGGVPTWGTDLQGSGGAGAWATSSSELYLYPADPNDVVVVGANATSTTGNIFEVAGNSLFRGTFTGTNLVTALNFLATSTSASSTFPNLNATNATATNATTTNLAVTGNASTSNLRVSNTLIIGALSGFLKATAGTVASALIDLAADVTGILPVANGGTGWAAVAAGAVPYGNGSSALATTSAGTNGQVLALVGGVPAWVSTTTLSTISGTLGVGSGGTGLTSITNNQLLIGGAGNTVTQIATSSLGLLTTNVAEGTNQYYLDSRVQAFVHGSTTIPKTYTANTFTGLQTISNASTTLLSASYASSTLYYGAGLADCNTGNMLTWTAGRFGCEDDTAGGGSADAWTHPAAGQSATTSLMIFNGGASSTLLSAHQAYFGATATSTFSSAGVLTLAGTPNGPLDARAGVVGATTSIGVLYGGTGLTTAPTAFQMLQGTSGGGYQLIATSSLFSTSAQLAQWLSDETGTGSFVLSASPTLTGTLTAAAASFSGNVAIGTSTPYATTTIWGNTTGKIFEVANGASTTVLSIAGSGFGTTTVSGLNVSGSATTTSNVGINITTGCFAINNTCLSSGSTNAAGGTGAVQFANGTSFAGDATNFFWDDNHNLLGLGTATPQFALTIASSTGPQLALTDGSATANPWTFRSAGGNLYIATSSPTTFATTSVSALSIIGSGGSVGIGTSTPNAQLFVLGTNNVYSALSGSPGLRIGDVGSSVWLDQGVYTGGYGFIQANSKSNVAQPLLLNPLGGSVGIGTTTPFRKLSITDAVSTAQQAIAYDSTRYTDLLTDSVGDFYIDPQGGDALIADDDLWVCTGGCSTGGGGPSGNGNLVVEAKVGIGTSTPQNNLDIVSSAPRITLRDNDVAIGANSPAWQIRATDGASGGFVIGTSTDYSTYSSWVTIATTSGRVGIGGTTTPSQQLSVADRLYVGALGATGMGTATSTFQGDIKITGKLDVSTIDPPYTIDGVKYATYVPSMTGVKEETVSTLRLEKRNGAGKYEAVIAFDDLEKGSDLWLFYQVVDFGDDWKNLVVQLTPSFDGQVFYTKDIERNALVISGNTAGEVSMRLTANRYDHEKWPNLRPDQDGDTEGTHVISSKKPKATIETGAAATATTALDRLSLFATSTMQFATSTFQKVFAWLR